MRYKVQLAMLSLATCISPALAQSAPQQATDSQQAAEAPGAASDSAADIVVTATKSVNATTVHRTPIAVTAFNEAALETGHVSALSDLTGSIPNVFLNASETVQGVNNFSIRGMAVYDTIPSNTPTVGIFQDGIYIGASAASALNTFDNESIEVLRGPQGLLFGRNVTAGALIVNSTGPTGKLTINARAAVASGPDFTESLVVSGPLTSDGLLTGKIAVYRNDDDGYFRNSFDGRKFGRSHSTILRAAVGIDPHGPVRTTVRFEHGVVDSQGPASQNHGVFSGDGFAFSINEPGYGHNRWTHVIADTRVPTRFGDGEFVNIAGYREVSERGLFDADSTPQTFFHFGTSIQHRQFSDELRYSGQFGPVTPTVGLYFYADRLNYVEDRVLAASEVSGGGIQKSQTYAIFGNFDVALQDDLVLTLGARYSTERKEVRIRGLQSVAASGCSLVTRSCSIFNFNDEHSWNAFTPKVGLRWTPTEATNLYAYWTKGFRSGGYNVRQTNLAAPPGPYAQEIENTYEIGIKQTFLDRRIRVNLAVFQNDYEGLQRAIFQASPTIGIAQTTVNSADTRIRGVEGELTLVPAVGVSLGGHFGYLDNSWRRIYFNLLGTGPVTPANYNLQLPFLSPWSYGLNASVTRPIGSTKLTVQVGFEHRDRTPSNDANSGFLKAVNQVDASALLQLDNGLSFSVYGKNLTNQATTGLNNPLTFTPGETIAPLNKGRVLGVEARFKL